MKVLDLFSGIAGFGLAFQRAGFDHLALCEQDKDCQRVLRRHFPEVEIINDVRAINPSKYPFRPDVICGGFPCQDVSVAGKRAGLAGERSGLWFEFRRIIESYQPRWVVIENVLGLLSGCGCESCQVVSRIVRIHRWLRKRRQIHQPCAVCNAGKRMLESHSGRNLAIILQGLAECGYGWAYRILDSQYDGVAQRRRRVFIVAGLGTAGERAAEILFEREGGCWDSPPRRETRQDIAGTVRSGTAGRSAGAGQSASGLPGNVVAAEGNNVSGAIEVATACNAHGGTGRLDFESETFLVNELAATLNSGGNDGGFRTEPGEHLIAHTLRGDGFDANEDGTGRGTPIVAQTITAHQFRSNGATAGNNGQPVNLQVVPFDTTQITSKANGSHPQAGNPCHPLAAGDHAPAIAFMNRGSNVTTDGRNFEAQEELAYALTNPGSGGRTHRRQIARQFGVRRLMPVECEALQGFPRDWTSFDDQGKAISDSARYRMLGNAVCEPTGEWIARRIKLVDGMN